MLSLDWKDRLKKDTVDFFERKLPRGDYDIDIIYNAYPERINGHVPHAVITFVGKIIASKIQKKADQYVDFIDYLITQKGENGSIVFAYILNKAIKNNPLFFLPYTEKIIFGLKEQKTCNLIISKVFYPLFTKNPEQYLDTIIGWLKKDDEILTESVDNLLKKFIKSRPDMIKQIFEKLENLWLYASPQISKLNVHFLKKTYDVDRDFYHSIFTNYKNTRNPTFAHILCDAIVCYSDEIQLMADNWSRSGNIKLKKIGQHGQKILKKQKRK